MEFPGCPACQKGHLVPLSINTSFGFWACTRQDCSYVLSAMKTPVTVYKGTASSRDVVKNGKSWTEYEF